VSITINLIIDLGAKAIVVTINSTKYINRDNKNYII
jgi:hypothetical protein